MEINLNNYIYDTPPHSLKYSNVNLMHPQAPYGPNCESKGKTMEGEGVGAKFPKLGLPRLWGPITLRVDL